MYIERPSPATTGRSMMLLSQFGKLESMDKVARVLSIHGTRANHVLHRSLFMPEYYVRLFDTGLGRSNCSCKLIELVYTCLVYYIGVHVNAIFFLCCIHHLHLQCDIGEIYGYFRACTQAPVQFVPGLPFRSEAWGGG